MRAVRAIEIIVGLVFVLAAAFKALDLETFAVQIRYYRILEDDSLIRGVALAAVAVEALLGALLVAGIRLKGLVYGATLVMLGVFTLLVIYAWIFHDIEDCGCFGEVLKLGPIPTIAKNVAMAALLIAAQTLRRRASKREEPGAEAAGGVGSRLLAVASLIAVAACAAAADNSAFFNPEEIERETPFSGIVVEGEETVHDLSTGEYFVAVLSSTCPHCTEAAAVLNDASFYEEVPQIVGLVYGTEEEFEDFESAVNAFYPLHRIDGMRFFELLGDAQEPPRFYIIRDGKSVVHYDSLHITLVNLLELAERASEAAPSESQ